VDNLTEISVLVLTGPVGVGKTTIGSAVSDLLTQTVRSHAIIDMDCLRECFPRPPHDPFHTALGLQNMAAVWSNYQRAGAQRLILVDVVESRDMVAAYHAAIPHAKIVVARLRASLPTIHERLARREVGKSLAWHQQRATELVAQMEHDHVEDVLIDTEGKTVDDIAREVMRQMQWRD
jgi:adenylylsulfate kinase-like enzyme